MAATLKIYAPPSEAASVLGTTHAWTPADITPATSPSAAVLDWWDADTIAQADASAVVNWTGAKGAVMSQATGSKQPILKTNIVNGHAVVRADGVDDFLTAPLAGLSALPLTVVTVIKTNTVGNRYAACGGASGNPRFGFGDTAQIFNGSSIQEGTPQLGSAFRVVNCVVNGASSSIRRNGVSVATGETGSEPPSSPVVLFAADDAGNQAGGGDIAFHIIINGALSTTDRDNLEGYLAQRYNLGFGTPPAPVTGGTIIDLSPYLDINEDDFDPVNADRITPQFAGSPAFAEGQGYVRDSVGNKEWHLPLKLKGGNTDTLHAAVRAIKKALVQGVTVEYKPDGASQSTFFDLERGKVDEHYQHFLVRAGWLRCALRMWTRPYGHTGTSRLVASVPGTTVLRFSAPSIAGDVSALGRLELSFASAPAASLLPMQPPPVLLAYGIAPAGSYTSLFTASALYQSGGGTVVGASGAVASQYHGVVPSPAFAQLFAGFIDINNAGGVTAYVGRHRVFAIANHRMFPATSVALQLQAPNGVMGPTALATGNATNVWQVIDLGEFGVPSTVGVPDLSQGAMIKYSVASGASQLASPGLRIAGAVLIPLNTNAGLMLGGNAQNSGAVFGMSGESPGGIYTAQPGLTNVKDLSAYGRGDLPRIPVGTAQIVAFGGYVNGYLAYDPLLVSAFARERFSFFR